MRFGLVLFACALVALEAGAAQQTRFAPVTASVSVTSPTAQTDLSDLAVWLTPIGDVPRGPIDGSTKPHLKMVQENKQFHPHLLVVRAGSIVDFPNNDPFFHNVFSMYDGKRFDLGLYEAGTSRSVPFARTGVCFIFCNIHPDMSAVIVVVDTPYFGVSARNGDIRIPDVPPGRYTMSIWHERYAAATPADATREITIAEGSRSLGLIRLVDTGKGIGPHKNKYGNDYPTPAPSSPVYR